ncbi:MAG: response regulator transcription factor [Culicoidibacterales bacterium]
MAKIMIVEDEPTIRIELATLLTRYGYEVQTPTNFQNILAIIEREDPDLILLDLQLPYYDGYHICRTIRETSMVPIIVVTSRNSEFDEVMSMNLGADDFLTKPYHEQILLARIQSVLRRTMQQNKEQDTLTYQGLGLDLKQGTVSYGDEVSDLTKNEFKILICLLQQPETIVSRDELMDYLWASDMYIDTNTLTVNVNRLRKKLEQIGAGDRIETKRGMGYVLR